MIPSLKSGKVSLKEIITYLTLYTKHSRLIVLLMALSWTLGLTYFVFMQPLYYSESIVYVDYIPTDIDVQRVYRDSSPKFMQKMLNAPHIVERTARELGINAKYNAIRSRYVAKVRTAYDSERNLRIYVHAFSYDLARDWTEELLRQFEIDRQEKRLKKINSTLEKYQEEMALLKRKSEEYIASRIAFAEENKLTNLKITLRQLKDIPAMLSLAKYRLEKIDNLRRQVSAEELSLVEKIALVKSLQNSRAPGLNSLMGGLEVGETFEIDQFLEAEESMVADGTGEQGKTDQSIIVLPNMMDRVEDWERLQNELMRVQRSIREKEQTYLPGHRIMKELNAELADINEALQLEYDLAMDRLDLEYWYLKDMEEQLEYRIPDYYKAQLEHQRYQIDMSNFRSGHLGWSGMFNRMNRKLATMEFAVDKDAMDFTYGGIVELPSSPVSPNRYKLVYLGTILGLLLGVGFPFLIEFLDHTISNVEQAEDAMQIPSLGVIPKYAEQAGASRAEAATMNDRSFHENFRNIRTNLLLDRSLGDMPKTIMVTSALPREGKTFIASNLAVSFSELGERVLIIDADLRRGNINRNFKVPHAPGLGEALEGTATVDEIIRQTESPNLSIIPSGRRATSIYANNFRLDRLNAILEDLRGRFDRIIVDSPPVLGISETSVLQHVLDGIIFVVSHGQSPQTEVTQAISLLRKNGGRFFGFVLNRMDLTSSYYYQHYYYYSNDYYQRYQASVSG